MAVPAAPSSIGYQIYVFSESDSKLLCPQGIHQAVEGARRGFRPVTGDRAEADLGCTGARGTLGQSCHPPRLKG